ncbi:hypothetical protein K227x_52810 [Rubripirellula lacrimiformis]|uniref:Leucine Rich repeats (2 copies) n=1 Tax=Rubripirellula lacrimiformis TaxID=1930273 RepID=A0A517NIA0_9BACT|nr:hypothetical protein [Rubripirellula lacrimiformis]QDT06860.1 hypothetical protein K227x_52810 [Rubripirellula lacrimiformis]
MAAEPPHPASDRTTLLLPIIHRDATIQTETADQTEVAPDSGSSPTAPKNAAAHYPDQSLGSYAGEGWRAYMQVWREHHRDPANAEIRRFLGLPLSGSPGWSAKRSRSAPSWLNWKPGTYAQIDTPHFVIYSQADKDDSVTVADDLERCYWGWTQMFFPLWEGSPQVTGVMAGAAPDDSIVDHLKSNRGRITIRRKMKVILFRDVSGYAAALARDVPGIERSTGFYSDARKAMCVYAAENDDAATRRHELVHQLFREATRSGLGRSMPGEARDFWLVEGIAGYFESLSIHGNQATVGGWDSPRLQFARYRVLVGGDQMPPDELRTDGRLAAQRRDDIARWYAHAIAETHRMLDGGNLADRLAVYHQLAELYRIDSPLDDTPIETDQVPAARKLSEFLAINDATLIDNPSNRQIQSLCFAGCQVTETGLASIDPQPDLTWLDLARLPVGNEAVLRLAPNPARLEQLTLEATQVDNQIATWLSQAVNLRELDLSWTDCGDPVLDAIQPAAKISVLWMTGTAITDESIDTIAAKTQLSNIDVQRTGVSETGLNRIRQSTDAKINPLELRPQP